MSGDAPDQTADLLKNLSLDSQAKTNEAEDAAKKLPAVSAAVPVQNEPANGDAANQSAQSAPAPSRSPSFTPILNDLNQVTDVNMCYLQNGYPSFIYGGYDGSNNWEDYSRYMNSDGAEVGQGVYGDIYGYGYASYGSYPTPGSPIPTMGHDGQLYGPQQYQYPASYYQPPTPQPSASFIPNQTPTQRDISASAATNQLPVSADTTKTTFNGTAKGNLNGSNVSVPFKPSQQNTSVTTNDAYGRGGMPGGLPTSGYQDPRYGLDGVQSPAPWFDPTLFPTGQHRLSTTSSLSSTTYSNGSTPASRTQSQNPLSHYMGMHTPRPVQGMVSASYFDKVSMYPNNRLHGQFGNTFRSGYGYGTNGYDSRTSDRWNGANDNRYNKPRARGNGSYGYGNDNLDGLNELSKGPRGSRFKNPKTFGTNVTIVSKGQNISTNPKEDASGVIPNLEQYNREDFPEQYLNAKFFIIKSYSEDDVHRSIKYSVWASTPNGNAKLDTAFKEAQERAGGCPVFLFFSVNTSGQFVGAAEMVGPVDFEKTLDYWQQDKWFGCFPVKWHIVKDVPNNLLKHITLENNDNKPVTNSRDTQEVKLEQGLQMLKFFKEYVSKTSIFDDFDFYESRQNLMQEKKAKQKQLQKQGLDGKKDDAVDEKVKDGTDAEPKTQKEPVSVAHKESVRINPGESNAFEGNGDVGAAGDAPKDASPATESTAESGAANGY